MCVRALITGAANYFFVCIDAGGKKASAIHVTISVDKNVYTPPSEKMKKRKLNGRATKERKKKRNE